MTLNHAFPNCDVEIYPFEGGLYTLGGSGSPAPLLACTTEKPLRGAGICTLTLAPGGPKGAAGPGWASILTRMSLILIGMRRGPYARVVMAALVDGVEESTNYTPQGAVQRLTIVRGTDFTKFFNTFSYFNLFLLTGLGSGALGQLGLPTELNAGLTQGTPEVLGAAWFQLMAGQQGILGQTQVPYAGQAARFGDLMSTWFQPYGDPEGIAIPSGANFLGDQGSWMDKFESFFPFPWYELFVTTAQSDDYPAASLAAKPITLPGYPPVSPTLVARRNPLPTLLPPGGSSSATSGNTVTVTASTFQLDQVDWQALPDYSPDGDDLLRGFRSLGLQWSDDEVRNFYVLNPTYLSTLFGGSNGNVGAFALNYAAWVDVASIHRYGYRPVTSELAWMADPTGSYAVQQAAAGRSADDFQAFVARIALRVPAYHQPTALMARATIVQPLRPDILPGGTFVFAPHRDGVLWRFYIEAVRHDYLFGQAYTTTLSLSRGLPDSVYQDHVLLRNVHLGNAMQQNGKIVQGLPAGLGNSLRALNQQTSEAVLAATAGVFSTQNPG